MIIVIAIFAVIFLAVIFLAFRIGVEYNTNDIEVTWDAFNTSIAVLELYIVFFSVGIAILGIWGYREIKNKCIEAVLKEYEKKQKYGNRQFRERRDQLMSDNWGDE